MGPLAEPKYPDIPGLDSFKGAKFHSARWDHDHDLKGERVASIGTGASAIQLVPAIQPDVEKLHVFQRTPPWIFPHSNRADQADRAAALPGVPRAPAARARRRVRDARDGGARLRQAAAADEAGRGASRASTCASRSATPSCCEKVDAGLHDRLQADPALEPLVPRARQAERRARDRRHLGGARALDRHGRRHRARGRHDHLQHRLPRGRHAGGQAGARTRRRDARRAVEGQPARAPRLARCPASRTCSCCSARTPASGTARWST